MRLVPAMTAIPTLLLAAGAAGLASTTHCAAMCGPLAAAACSDRGRDGARAVASYGVGRLVSYATTGAIAGAMGGALVRSLRGESVQKAVAVAIGVSLAVTAVRVLRARRTSAPVPLRRSKDAPRPPAALAGLLTGFLPCGALASALVIAAGAASWWGGALAMVTFALASAPGLVAALAAGRAVSSLFARAAAVRYVAAGLLLMAGAWVAARPWTMPERTCHCHAAASRVTSPGGG